MRSNLVGFWCDFARVCATFQGRRRLREVLGRFSCDLARRIGLSARFCEVLSDLDVHFVKPGGIPMRFLSVLSSFDAFSGISLCDLVSIL